MLAPSEGNGVREKWKPEVNRTACWPSCVCWTPPRGSSMGRECLLHPILLLLLQLQLLGTSLWAPLLLWQSWTFQSRVQMETAAWFRGDWNSCLKRGWERDACLNSCSGEKSGLENLAFNQCPASDLPHFLGQRPNMQVIGWRGERRLMKTWMSVSASSVQRVVYYSV